MSDVPEPSPAFRGDRPAAASAQGLADRNALTAVAVERTRMPMIVTDPRQPDNPLVLANKAFLSLTGYAAEAVIGRNCRFMQGEGTSAAAIAELRRAVKAERALEIEILNYRKDGSAFFNQLSISPVHDDAGRLLYFFGSQIDVTLLRKVQGLEASEHRLLMEIDHRARNVLAVVGGIVRLSRADDPAAYAAAVQQRVQVLAQAHSLLAEHGWREVPLEQVIRRQVDPFLGARMSLAGPGVLVSALAVQPVSLVIHELVENARVHGALSVPEGRVAVGWSRGVDDGGFDLLWREVGGPPPPPDARAGFGTVMTAAMIERQLGGRVERAWVDGGLTLRLRAPGAPGRQGA